MSIEKFLRKIGITSNLFITRKVVEVSLKHNEEGNLEEIKNSRHIEGKRNKKINREYLTSLNGWNIEQKQSSIVKKGKSYLEK